MVVDLSGFLYVKIDYDAGWYDLNPAINSKHAVTSFYVVSLAGVVGLLTLQVEITTDR
jgi:hypothetical protein